MKKKNFTLVELLCATALVVILAGIGFSAYSYASYRGKEAATKSLISRLGAALETLKTKHGFYPASASYDNIEISVNDSGLVDQVSFGTTKIPANKNSVTDAEKKQLKDFLSVIDGESLKKNIDAGNKLTDAWGGSIKYRYPGKVNELKFDLIAPGADACFGIAALDDPKEVSSENAATTRSYYVADGEWSCDDIANFK